MFKTKLTISICIFSILLGITSIIKTQTRITEKKIYKLDMKIAVIERDLHETQLDYFYVSAPGNLSKRINQLAFIEYSPIDFSRIYSTTSEFISKQKKITDLKINNEKKIKKN